MFSKKNIYIIIVTIFSLISLILTLFFVFRSKPVSINTLAANIKDNIDKLNDVSIFYNDRQVSFSFNPYIVNNRIFISVNDIKNIMKSISSQNSNDNISSISEDDLQKAIKTIGTEQYISIQSLENLYNLRSDWDFKNSTIKIYNKEEILKPQSNNNSKKAFIRLEDISPGGYYNNSENLKKLRIIADFLSSRGVIFHIAWIPRHIDPGNGYDCDPASHNSLYASEFIYTLDYLISHGGVVGLHGYTHQYKDTRTGEGYEFFSSNSLKVPSSSKYARNRIEKAIDSAKALGINYYFFECPHYAAAPNQLKIIEKYFQFIYQPNLDYNIKTDNKLVCKGDNTVYYVPTPLGYYGKNNNIIDNLNTIDDKTLASFFFHPTIEFKYIELKEDGEYYYSNTSPLHNIVNTFEQKGYKFESILKLKK